MVTKKIVRLSVLCLVAVICSLTILWVPYFAKAEPENDEIQLHVLMYHNILKSRRGTYIVSPDAFENDVKEIARRGYTFVLPSEVIAYCEGRGTLPKKCVMLTFDDGRYNNMYYGLPILERYSVKALFSVIGAFTEFTVTSGDVDNANYSHLTWEELKKLQDTGLVEIGNHTYNMHKYKPRFGIGRLPDETDEQYKNAVRDDIMRLQSKFDEYGIKSDVFAFPFGKITGTSKEILRESGFKMFLTCSEGVNKVKRGAPETLYAVKRFNRDGMQSTYNALKHAQIV